MRSGRKIYGRLKGIVRGVKFAVIPLAKGEGGSVRVLNRSGSSTDLRQKGKRNGDQWWNQWVRSKRTVVFSRRA